MHPKLCASSLSALCVCLSLSLCGSLALLPSFHSLAFLQRSHQLGVQRDREGMGKKTTSFVCSLSLFLCVCLSAFSFLSFTVFLSLSMSISQSERRWWWVAMGLAELFPAAAAARSLKRPGGVSLLSLYLALELQSSKHCGPGRLCPSGLLLLSSMITRTGKHA
ncbi:hypothetical protein HPP92_009325 [Vanilla planifolia]|uniref:Transmembrane protein n=1 Tax=Vanilla planifolia TaxID=51239 RepID=A0A835V6V1_VANPL|nr:hypothetical protein HPP92_009325 [Vanilla planifolia]